MPEISEDELAGIHKFLIETNDKYLATECILKAIKLLLINEGILTKEEIAGAMEDYAANMLRISRISGFAEGTMTGIERVAEKVREFGNREGEPLIRPVEDES